MGQGVGYDLVLVSFGRVETKKRESYKPRMVL